MSLTPGTRFGQFDVIAQIGAGGMGEVWRARDSQLGRDVALKILPAAVAGDPDRLMRFEREAKTLASLNHPNIASHVARYQSKTRCPLPDKSPRRSKPRTGPASSIGI
jgi:serine/threonine protein kinase